MEDDPVNEPETILGKAVETVRDYQDGIVQVADGYRSDTVSAVQSNPLRTLAIAASIGFAIGAIWKS